MESASPKGSIDSPRGEEMQNFGAAPGLDFFAAKEKGLKGRLTTMPASQVGVKAFDFGGAVDKEQMKREDSESSKSGMMQIAADGDSDESSVIGGQAPAVVSNKSNSDDGGMQLADDSDESGVMQMGGDDDESSVVGN